MKVKCKHCNKTRDVHTVAGNCPMGIKHRTLGWCQFAKTKYAEPDLPDESFFKGWRIDHDLTGTWRAECPDWGVSFERKTFKGLVSAMRTAKGR